MEASVALASKHHFQFDWIYIIRGQAPCADHLVAQGALEEISRQIQIQLGTMGTPFETSWDPTEVI
jgi:hypothetical protein